MSAQWNSIRNNLNNYIKSQKAMDSFARAQKQEPILQGLASPSAVVTQLLGGQRGSLDTCDAIAASLIRLAQGAAERQLAHALLWLGLWRHLCRIYQRRLSSIRCRSELASLLSATLHEQVSKLDLASVRRVIATLVKNTERNLLREHFRAVSRHHYVDDMDSVLTDDLPLLSGEEQEHITLDSHRALRLINGTEQELLLAVVIHEEPVEEVANTLGISDGAARKRVQRVLARVRRTFDKSLAHAGQVAWETAPAA